MYYYITDKLGISQFQKALISFPEDSLGFDTETTGLDPFTCTALLAQIDIGSDQFVFDLRKLGDGLSKYVMQLIQDRELIGFNLKFDVKLIKQKYDVLFTKLWDIQLAEVLVYNGLVDDRYPSLEFVAAKYLGVELDKSVRKSFYDPNWDGVITQQQIQYSAEDVAYLKPLKKVLSEKINEQKQGKIIDLENRLIPVTSSMELSGIGLDIDQWLGISKDEEEKKIVLEKELIETFVTDTLKKSSYRNALDACNALKIFGSKKLSKKLSEQLQSISGDYIKQYLIENINIGSPSQLLNILKVIYGIDIDSTNEKIMNKHEAKYPIIKKIIEFREHSKKVAAFGEKFSNNIHPVTGRLHVNMNQLGTRSGRFSSSPNMLNIPQDNRYRNCFVARLGKRILAIDFSQEELRLIAVCSGEPNMIKAYVDGIDLHTATASLLFNVPVELVTKDQRKIGKTLNFAVGYGSTKYGLYKNFGIPLDDAEKYLDMFYNTVYPVLRDWKRLLGQVIWDKGFSKTFLGRKRFFKKSTIYSDLREMEKYRASVERELINHVVQGCGADIIKESLIRLFFENPFGNKYTIILQVYDEIVIEVDEDIVKEADEFTSKIMRECETKYLEGIVPAVVETALMKDGEYPKYWVK